MAAHYIGNRMSRRFASLSRAAFTPTIPDGKTIVHNTVDPGREQGVSARFGGGRHRRRWQAVPRPGRRRVGPAKGPRTEPRAHGKDAWSADTRRMAGRVRGTSFADADRSNGYRMFRELLGHHRSRRDDHPPNRGCHARQVRVVPGGPAPRRIGWASPILADIGRSAAAWRWFAPSSSIPTWLRGQRHGRGAVSMTASWTGKRRRATRSSILSVVTASSGIFSRLADQHIPEAIERLAPRALTGNYAAIATALQAATPRRHRSRTPATSARSAPRRGPAVGGRRDPQALPSRRPAPANRIATVDRGASWCTGAAQRVRARRAPGTVRGHGR